MKLSEDKKQLVNDTIHAYVNNLGGKVLVGYSIIRNPIKVQCSNGHTWKNSWADIRKGQWCPYCAKKAKPSIIVLQQHANQLGGCLISTEYKNNNDKLTWQCKKGHSWSASWNHIQQGCWCPKCFNKTEELCRISIENHFEISFKKTRFYYAKPKKIFFEFDGYNEDYKIAFEYHGYQHYVYPNRWHHTEGQFKLAQLRDKAKERYCLDNGITLIVIPYTEDLLSYIKKLNIQELLCIK